MRVGLAVASGATVVPVDSVNPLPVTSTVSASGAATPCRLRSAAGTNATSVKATPGVIWTVVASNTSAVAAKFCKFFNKASAPTVGTDIPILVVLVPASSTVTVPVTAGLQCTAGIGLTITGLEADTDVTAVAAGDIHLTLAYS